MSAPARHASCLPSNIDVLELIYCCPSLLRPIIVFIIIVSTTKRLGAPVLLACFGALIWKFRSRDVVAVGWLAGRLWPAAASPRELLRRQAICGGQPFNFDDNDKTIDDTSPRPHPATSQPAGRALLNLTQFDNQEAGDYDDEK